MNDSDDPFQSLNVEVEENTISVLQSNLQKLSERFNVGCIKEDEDIRLSKPSYAEVVKAISIVESYSVCTTFGDDLRKALCDATRSWKGSHREHKTIK